MGCQFCEDKSPLMPGYTGEQYHAYNPLIGGHPRCAYEFTVASRTHPLVPKISSPYCDFCGLGEGALVHDISKPTRLY